MASSLGSSSLVKSPRAIGTGTPEMLLLQDHLVKCGGSDSQLLSLESDDNDKPADGKTPTEQSIERTPLLPRLNLSDLEELCTVPIRTIPLSHDLLPDVSWDVAEMEVDAALLLENVSGQSLETDKGTKARSCDWSFALRFLQDFLSFSQESAAVGNHKVMSGDDPWDLGDPDDLATPQKADGDDGWDFGFRALSPPKPPPPPTSSAKLPFGMTPKIPYKINAPLRKVNWKKIEPVKLNANAFWRNVREDKWVTDDLIESLTREFGSKPKNAGAGCSDKHVWKMKPVKKLHALDKNTAHNLAIVICAMKMTNLEIKNAIFRCDTTKLPPAILKELIGKMPTEDQVKRLRNLSQDAVTDLVDAERFALEIGGIDDIRIRLSALSFKQRFVEDVQCIKPNVLTIITACEEGMRSSKFAKVLEVILLMGNIMNTGSQNAQSIGFELSYLPKLSDTKTIDQSRTLLHVLAEFLAVNSSDAANFYDELLHISKAARISKTEIGEYMKDMANSIKELEQYLTVTEAISSIKDEGDKFGQVMGSFAETARRQFEELQILFSSMEQKCVDLAKFFCFDMTKYPVEQFFGDVDKFISDFRHAVCTSIKRGKPSAKPACAQERVTQNQQIVMLKRNTEKQCTDRMQDLDGLLEFLDVQATLNAFERETRPQKSSHANRAIERAQFASTRTRTNVFRSDSLLPENTNDPINLDEVSVSGRPTDAFGFHSRA